MSAARDVIARRLFLNYLSDSEDVRQADAIIRDLAAAGYRIVGPGEVDRETLEKAAKPVEDWHEDDGYAVWWTWEDGQWLGEPSYIGSPLCEDWPGYHTHWTPHPDFPPAIRALGGKDA